MKKLNIVLVNEKNFLIEKLKNKNIKSEKIENILEEIYNLEKLFISKNIPIVTNNYQNIYFQYQNFIFEEKNFEEIQSNIKNVSYIDNQILYFIENKVSEDFVFKSQEFFNSINLNIKFCPIESKSHIDYDIRDMFCLINMNTVLVNPHVFRHNFFPEHFKNMNTIWCPEPNGFDYNNHKNFWKIIDLYFLNENIIVIDDTQFILRKELEKNNLEVIPIKFSLYKETGLKLHDIFFPIYN